MMITMCWFECLCCCVLRFGDGLLGVDWLPGGSFVCVRMDCVRVACL